MAQSPCLIADLMSYCVCCCLTEVLENCTVEEGVAWREWQGRVIMVTMVNTEQHYCVKDCCESDYDVT